MEAQEKVRLAAQIFDKYQEEIYAAIRLHVNNKSEIDDIFQDLFLSFIRRPIPTHIENLRGYIYRAVKNDVLDAARRTKAYQVRIAKYAERCSLSTYSLAQKDPQNIVILTEETQKMLELIEKHLPRSEAEAIVRRYVHDLNIDDAAEKMHINKRTFSRYLCLGLKKVRQFIREKQSESQ